MDKRLLKLVFIISTLSFLEGCGYGDLDDIELSSCSAKPFREVIHTPLKLWVGVKNELESNLDEPLEDLLEWCDSPDKWEQRRCQLYIKNRRRALETCLVTAKELCVAYGGNC